MRVLHADQPLLRPDVNWFVYALLHPSNCAPYIGSTNDLARRLRQHNGEIAGGARRTSAVVKKTGLPWFRTLHVKNFPDHRSCLSFEKCMQRTLRGLARAARAAKLTPMERCTEAVTAVMARTAPSTLAIPYAEYEMPLEVVREN